MTAMALFEAAGAVELAIDAASLGAAHASRLGELALASELATKSILGLDSVNDDRLRWEITNRLGIFCYSFFDYERAVEQFEISLAIAERMGDKEKVCRQLHNIADTLLLASRQRQTAGFGLNADQLGRAGKDDPQADSRRPGRDQPALWQSPLVSGGSVRSRPRRRSPAAAGGVPGIPKARLRPPRSGPRSRWCRPGACDWRVGARKRWRRQLAAWRWPWEAMTSKS